MAPARPFRIGLLLYPSCMPSGLFAFADLLHAANRRSGAALFEPVFVAMRPGRVACAHGQSLEAAAAIRAAALQAVLIPGFWAESPQQVMAALERNRPLAAELAGLPRNVMTWSYCTGVGLAAASGRLQGQAATITWWLADLMRQAFPRTDWQTERTSVWNARTATASGVGGHLPLAQSLIEKHLSVDAYRELTGLMVLPRPERTHRVFQEMSLVAEPNRLLQKLHAVVERIPAADLSVARLAGELHTTERTLSRKVSAATGTPVGQYVRSIKLNQVSERLIHTSAPASTISMTLGFSSDASMRRMFKALTAMTPGEYRQAFGRA
ncbi:MAG TPA: helix-turn-helix domain-containing protein [Noviherbaspirillum sp.]|jgi:transcriptional regulator GlxA family with amidase domain|uniref:GlxA family transcriptional regulator n=1 Tax=Noviherbaspirillum sp. TaxID=1926288 RepID=UPI002F95D1C7